MEGAIDLSLNDSSVIGYTLRQVGLSARTPVRVCTTRLGVVAKPVVLEGVEHGEQGVDHHFIERAFPEWDATCVLHTHAFYEVALFHHGTCWMTSSRGREEGELTRGDVVVMLPYYVHGYHQPTPLCWTDLYLLPDWLLEDLRILWQVGGLVQHLLAHALFRSPATQKLVRLRTTPEETEAWEREIAQMEEESKQPQPCLATINGCLLKVLGTLNRAFLRSPAGRDTPMHPDIWRAAYCIEQSIRRGERFEPAALASQMAMSQRTVERLFRRWTAVTPSAAAPYCVTSCQWPAGMGMGTGVGASGCAAAPMPAIMRMAAAIAATLVVCFMSSPSLPVRGRAARRPVQRA